MTIETLNKANEIANRINSINKLIEQLNEYKIVFARYNREGCAHGFWSGFDFRNNDNECIPIIAQEVENLNTEFHNRVADILGAELNKSQNELTEL